MMFKQITREEYLLLADAGVKVSAWRCEDDFRKNKRRDFFDDARHHPGVVEEIRDEDPFWTVFYAWIDDEQDADHHA